MTSSLWLRRDLRLEDLPSLAAEVDATSVHVSAETTPYGRRRDARVAAALPDGVRLVATGSPYAVTPGRILTAAGSPYGVFSPFARAWRSHGWRPPARPGRVRWFRGPHGDALPAGTGTDPAPYLRVFNPVLQGEKFDPDGDYVRRYVPGLAHLPGAAAHRPWEAPGGYDHGYPRRVVDPAAERAEALRRYADARGVGAA